MRYARRASACSASDLRAAAVVIAGLCLTLLPGCGGDELDLVDAYGTVTLDGQPLADAQVTFSSPQNGETYGRTDKNGYYRMEFSSSRSGTFLGKQTVRITTAAIWDEEALEDADLDELPQPKERVPDRYNTNSELTVEVTKGGAPYDFELTSN